MCHSAGFAASNPTECCPESRTDPTTSCRLVDPTGRITSNITSSVLRSVECNSRLSAERIGVVLMQNVRLGQRLLFSLRHQRVCGIFDKANRIKFLAQHGRALAVGAKPNQCSRTVEYTALKSTW